MRFTPLHPRFQPLLFLGAAFAVGIAVGRLLPVRPALWGLIGSGVGVIGLCCRQTRAFLPLMLVGYAMAGIVHLQAVETRVPAHRLRLLYDRGLIAAGEVARVVGRLRTAPERAPDRVYLDLAVEQIEAFRSTYRARGRLHVMIPLADSEARAAYEALGLRAGMRVRALVRIARRTRYQNPGSPEYDEYLEHRGYDLRAVSKSPRLIEPVSAPSTHVGALLSDVRELLERQSDRVFHRAGPQTVGVVKALLLGNRRALDARLVEAFRAGGTFHLLVISGLHIGFLSGVIFWIISRYTRHPVGRAVGTLAPVWGYAVMVGMQPPVARATVMLSAWLMASLLFRQAQMANGLGMAALILLVADPRQLFSPSFHLTFLAAGSLILLVAPLVARLWAIGTWQPAPEHPSPPCSPPLVRGLAEILFWDERRFQREQATAPIRFRLEKNTWARALNRVRLQPLVRAVMLSLLVSVIVQMAILPLMIEYFHRAPFIGIVLNVTMSVLVAFFGLLAAAALALSFLDAMSLSAVLAEGCRRVLEMMRANFDLALRFSWLSPRLPDYSGAGVVVYLAYWIPLAYAAYRLHAWKPLEEPPREHRGRRDTLGPRDLDRGGSHDPSKDRRGDLSPRGISRVARSLRVRARGGALVVVFVWVGSLVLLLTHPVRWAHPAGTLALHFLDVGHGDATLIEFPDGQTMLIDAGGEVWPPPSNVREHVEAQGEPEFLEERPSLGEMVVSAFLWSRGLRRIEYLVPTQADADHIRGFFDVVRNFDVGAVLLAREPTQEPLLAEFVNEVRRRGIPILTVTQGDRIWVGRDVMLSVLWPPPEAQPETWGNDRSLVLRVQYGAVSILLTGDIEREAEEALLASGVEVRSDILKVPHHGSRTSSHDAFLDRVNPRWAIISADDPITSARFRHPHPDVRARYERRQIALFHTGQQGTITVLTDGRTVRFRLGTRALVP